MIDIQFTLWRPVSRYVYERRVYAFIALYIIQFALIYIFYNNIINKDVGKEVSIKGGYGWKELVQSIERGRYEAKVQTGLDSCFSMTSRSMRPPIYPFYLYGLTYFGPAAAALSIFFGVLVSIFICLFAYKIIYVFTKSYALAQIGFALVYLYPMNFMKAGVLDEAPLMILFVLVSTYILVSKECKNKYVLAGLFFGLGVMTRTTALFMLPALIVSLLLGQHRRKYTDIFVFLFIIALVVSPWLIRNYTIYDDWTLGHGAGRLLYITQTDEFIRKYPQQSIDEIERRVLTRDCRDNGSKTSLNEKELDELFTAKFVEQLSNNPMRFIKSLYVRAKAVVPIRAFPIRAGDALKNAIYVGSSWLIILFVTFSLFRYRNVSSYIILLMAMIYFLGGVFTIMLARHTYPFYLLCLIFGVSNIQRGHEQ
jgi:4-amino-4-deoxy-L-arabinose transferase-like glycosyltransferase